LGSACQQAAEKQGSQREGAGHGAEHRKPGPAARADVRENCDTRHQYRSEVGDQRRPVTSGDLVLLGGDVPDAGGYQNGKGGLGDLVEPAGRSTRHLGSGAAEHGCQRGQCELAAESDGGRAGQPERFGADGEHSCGCRFRLGIVGGMSPTMAVLGRGPFA
jgi:hypothetical protein